MKNLLTLHEAVIIALLKMPNRTASFEEIAKEIEKRNLYSNRKGNISLAKQIELRTSISSNKYNHLFEKISQNEIKFI